MLPTLNPSYWGYSAPPAAPLAALLALSSWHVGNFKSPDSRGAGAIFAASGHDSSAGYRHIGVDVVVGAGRGCIRLGR